MSDSAGENERVTVRRAPKFGSFIGLGAVVGVVVAVVAYLLNPVETEFGAGATIGFLGLLLAGVGMTLGAAVALFLDRVLSKRARSVTAERTDQDDE